MHILKKISKSIIFIFLVFLSLAMVWRLWWYAPVSVKASNIEKMNVHGIHEDQVKDCDAFTLTPEEFRAYWKDAKPIFEVESHDYSFGSCYFKTVENGKEYEIGIGGTGTITKDDTTYYYVRKGDKPDFADMPPVKTTLTQDIQATMHLIKYVLANGIN